MRETHDCAQCMGLCALAQELGVEGTSYECTKGHDDAQSFKSEVMKVMRD